MLTKKTQTETEIANKVNESSVSIKKEIDAKIEKELRDEKSKTDAVTSSFRDDINSVFDQQETVRDAVSSANRDVQRK